MQKSCVKSCDLPGYAIIWKNLLHKCVYLGFNSDMFSSMETNEFEH